MSLVELMLQMRAALEEQSSIYAFWIEGSYATGKFAGYSDINVWLDVDKDKFTEAERLFYDTLTSLIPVRTKTAQNVYSAMPWLAKSSYRLLNMSDQQRIELDMQAHGRDFLFVRSRDKIITIFDKSSVIQWDEA